MSKVGPEIMSGGDHEGIIGVRRDLAKSPAAAFRYALGFEDWLTEDMPGKWIKDETEFRLDIGPLRERVSRIVVKSMRPAQNQDEWADPFGEDTWLWTTDIVHPQAVEYWDLTQV